MDLDDLLDESNNSNAVLQQSGKNVNQGGRANLEEGEDDWGDTSIQRKANPMLNKAKSHKVEESKREEEDDWGDLDMNQKVETAAATGKMQAANKENEPDDDWGIITPAPPKKKKVEDIGVKSRKQEDPDDEDEWGDTTSSKFKLKSESFSYYDCTTGTEPKLMPNTQSKPGGTKCFPLTIGGASLEHGLTDDSMAPKSCSSLRCYKCDKKVQRFINGTWHATVDYMFVRNHNTNVAKLKEGVQYEPGWSAYACQCQFISVCEADKDKCEDLKWMCGGH